MRDTPSRTILVVEDDAPTRALFGQILIDQGWRTSLAADGERALRLAEEERPGIVLLDMHLPGIPPPQVAHQLRQVCGPALAIVATSASTERESAALLGASAFVAKPFDLDDLLTVVHNVLRLASDVQVRAKALRDESERARIRLAAVRDSGQTFGGAVQAQSADEALLRAIESTGAQAGSLVLAGRRYKLQLAAIAGFSDDLADLWQEFPADASVPIAHAAGGEPIWLRSIEDGLDRYPEILSAFSTTPWAEAMCAVPLSADRYPLGAIGLIFDSPREFDRAFRDRVVRGIDDSARLLAYSPTRLEL